MDMYDAGACDVCNHSAGERAGSYREIRFYHGSGRFETVGRY